ncbi:helix-hairpin-helix domain-containing protein [uncultured Neptuniibacter sp.]|uniref:ComEA family DNA-binding protein n=1 Tax=uncultured Neptuniibacter sp. TaxID=502143 RepID=UPI00260AF551|nr:helix-hairpin-helix domain-containing protein [uncultured Neptuniibacter sp.]
MKLRSIRTLLLAFICLFTLPAFAEIDINQATATELSDGLSGIGERKAEAIIAYREAHGPFQSIEQLAEVKGIGAATIEKNRSVITLGLPKEDKTQPSD